MTTSRRQFITRSLAGLLIGKRAAVSSIPQDYPDFLRVAQNQGPALYNPGAIVTGGSVLSPAFYVGPWSSLAIDVVIGGAATQWGGFVATFFADQALTISTSAVPYVGVSGSTVREVLTCRGQWVRFTSAYVAGPGNTTITPLVIPLAGNQNVDNNTDQYEYLFNNQAYGISQTIDLPLTPWTPGPCLLSVQGTAAYAVQMQDWQGPGSPVGQTFALIVSAAPWEINAPINIGRRQPTLVVANGAGAQTIQASVIGAAA